MPPAEKAKKESKAQKDAAAKLAARQEAAENAFAQADADGSGQVDATELQGLLMNLLTKEGIEFDRQIVAEFVSAEFAKADTDGSGDVDFDEFVNYYNGLVDRLAGNAMTAALEDAKKATAKKLEEAAIAEDPQVYEGLHALVHILSHPSVRAYSGLVVPFKMKDRNADCTPNPEHGSTSHGLVLDLSRRAQRLLTPWGSLPIGYRLSFEGYQEKVPPAEAEDTKSKGRGKKGAVPWALVPADPAATETHPIFFDLAKPQPRPPPGQEAPPLRMLGLKKLPMRCQYQVVELCGNTLPVGEAIAVTGKDELKKLGDRFQAMVRKYPKDPMPQLPMDDAEGGPLVNHLVRPSGIGTVAVRPDRFEMLRKRKEVTQRTGPKKFSEEDMEFAMLVKGNDDGEAAKFLVKMQGMENNVIDKRAGHATRAMTRNALRTCEFDEEHAEWMLKNSDKLLKKSAEEVLKSIENGQGIKTGLGYPSRMELERLLVYKRCDMGPVLAELKRKWKQDIEAMTEIIAASEVEEMLTPERCESFAFSRPVTGAEAMHVEDLYLSDEFKRDQEAVVKFLSEAGTVLKRAFTLGNPTRQEVEDLLRDLDHDSEKVLTFLGGWSSLMDLAPKQGGATREECKRYMQIQSKVPAIQQAAAECLLKTIWQLANPKPPKPPGKGSKAPPKRHYSQECGFPSRDECEWALLGTRSELKDTDKGPSFNLKIDAAADLLIKLQTMYDERKYVALKREDFKWCIDPDREKAMVKVRPLTPAERGETPGQIMCAALNAIVMSLDERNLKTNRQEMYTALEKFKFVQADAEKWLFGVGSLMQQQSELSITSREEVEAAMVQFELDDEKVIELFQVAHRLQKRKLEIGNPTREEIKAILDLAWEEPDREEVAAKCLTFYRQLMSDDAQLMTLFGKSPEQEEIIYIRKSILRFKGDNEASMNYLKNVAEIESKGESVGRPSRELIIAELDKYGLDKRKAQQAIREEYHKRRDEELNAEYAKKKAEADKKKGA